MGTLALFRPPACPRPQWACRGPGPHPAPSSAPRGLSHPSPFSFPQVHLGDADYLQDLCWALVREWAPRLKGPALELPGELSDSEPHLGVSQRVPNQGWS